MTVELVAGSQETVTLPYEEKNCIKVLEVNQQ